MCEICDTFQGWRGSTSSKLGNFFILDYYDGALVVLSHCVKCRAALLLSVLAWNPPRSVHRVYAISLFPSDRDQEVRNRTGQWDDEFIKEVLSYAGKPVSVVLSDNLLECVLGTIKCPEPAPQLILPEEVDSSTLLAQWLELFPDGQKA